MECNHMMKLHLHLANASQARAARRGLGHPDTTLAARSFSAKCVLHMRVDNMWITCNRQQACVPSGRERLNLCLA
eukprot:3251409-Amphidinium_carterae.1